MTRDDTVFRFVTGMAAGAAIYFVAVGIGEVWSGGGSTGETLPRPVPHGWKEGGKEIPMHWGTGLAGGPTFTGQFGGTGAGCFCVKDNAVVDCPVCSGGICWLCPRDVEHYLTAITEKCDPDGGVKGEPPSVRWPDGDELNPTMRIEGGMP